MVHGIKNGKTIKVFEMCSKIDDQKSTKHLFILKILYNSEVKQLPAKQATLDFSLQVLRIAIGFINFLVLSINLLFGRSTFNFGYFF
jgi:hypothetical protein